MAAGEDGPASILSTGERAVARHLREDPDRAHDAIAEARGVDPAQVEAAVGRIREKTDRAVATLVQSPFAAEALAALDPAERAAIRAALADADGTAADAPGDADPGDHDDGA